MQQKGTVAIICQSSSSSKSKRMHCYRGFTEGAADFVTVWYKAEMFCIVPLPKND